MHLLCLRRAHKPVIIYFKVITQQPLVSRYQPGSLGCQSNPRYLPPPLVNCACVFGLCMCVRERHTHTHTHHTDALLLLTLVSNNPFDQDDLNSETFLMFAIVFFKYT